MTSSTNTEARAARNAWTAGAKAGVIVTPVLPKRPIPQPRKSTVFSPGSGSSARPSSSSARSGEAARRAAAASKCAASECGRAGSTRRSGLNTIASSMARLVASRSAAKSCRSLR